MKAIEFEADTKNNIIKIPKEYKAFHSTHVKVILLTDENNQTSKKYDFSDMVGKLEWEGDPVAERNRLWADDTIVEMYGNKPQAAIEIDNEKYQRFIKKNKLGNITSAKDMVDLLK